MKEEPREPSYGSDYHRIPATSITSGTGVEVAEDLYGYTVGIVNIALVGRPGGPGYVLVDAGMPGSVDSIVEAAEERFGKGSRPDAIVLTHGHFDHVGAIVELLERWDVPVYAHPLELPFLTGEESYPEPDPSVEGGILAKISSVFPNEPIQLGSRIQALPEDGIVPHLPGFRWIHTPGHAPGQVALFREADRALIAGDAFITVRQDSLYKVLVQKTEVCGPPRYFTADWKAARESVLRLAALRPAMAITGHGRPMAGEELAEGLERLTRTFDQTAVPDHGKYV
ncbi:MBL fold metallo-hydrolase [Paenibacillus spiritus]|uniref:MBL fold metallo-hydrolase n=1 Tax=Paenibacillus spiritus TaxID=2496557 RepID=A0A5J5GAV2_9BACL|nr:MBL fold metallo-hydrolase [Paenibacillus spiritus]KAA9005033.1 MBL fold metallo-hydrolase [Paenibacillus spiritus]